MTVSKKVQEYIELNIDKLEKDKKSFLIEILDKRFNTGLSENEKGELITVLHNVGVDITKDVLDMLGYDHFYFNPDTKNAGQDYMKLLEDLVKNVPDQYIDSAFYANKSALSVIDKLQEHKPLNQYLIYEQYIQDYSLYVEDIIVETTWFKDRGIELRIRIETNTETAYLYVNPFPRIVLDSYGYMINRKEANNRLDLISLLVEEALSE